MTKLSEQAKQKREEVADNLNARDASHGLRHCVRYGFDSGYSCAMEEMQAPVAMLKEALEFYADGAKGDDLEVRPDKKELWSIPEKWSQRSMSDHWPGKRARLALEKLKLLQDGEVNEGKK
jgi:hypothetical protein